MVGHTWETFDIGRKKLIDAYIDLCRGISDDDEYIERYTENLIKCLAF